MKTIWDKYNYDRQIIDEFLSAFELKVRGCDEPINWKNTLSKILVWDGFKMDRNFDYSNLISKRKSNLFISILKSILLKETKKQSKLKSNNEVNTQDIEIAFCLNYSGEVEVLRDIVTVLGAKKIQYLIFYKRVDIPLNELPYKMNLVKTFNYKQKRYINIKIKKWPTKQALYVLNRFLDAKNEIQNDIAFFQNLQRNCSKLKAIVFVAGENQYSANLCSEFFKLTSVRVKNLMNGVKLGWIHDRDVDFSEWYVWNQKMKQTLVEKGENNPEMFKVIGHPLQKSIANYSYSKKIKSLNEFSKTFKKIVTLFTSPIKYKDQFDIYLEAINFFKNNLTFGLIIKPHPSIQEEELKRRTDSLENVLFIFGRDKTLSYDLISISQFTVSINSTVSFESTWMNKPNINFEEENESIMPIESDLFFHCNTIENFKIIFTELFNKPNENKVQLHSSNEIPEVYVKNLLN